MDNALLEDRNAELLHISKMARHARGKKQALDPVTQSRLEALAQPVSLSHPVGLDKKGASKAANIKDAASKRASGGESGRRAGTTTPPLFTAHSGLSRSDIGLSRRVVRFPPTDLLTQSTNPLYTYVILTCLLLGAGTLTPPKVTPQGTRTCPFCPSWRRRRWLVTRRRSRSSST